MDFFDEINRARQILELPEKMILKDIYKHYKKLLKRWHPDSCTEPDKKICEEKIKNIILSYKIIHQYCQNHLISFNRNDVEKNIPMQEKLRKQFEKYNFF
ncbi:MAG TPA: molecular chaperone DnaJ [Spirochaetia bacterium]|nr:molecular chaperone DnaJ [Spirochaetia bacterium]